MIKKALVIGGGGFIGHNLIKRLKQEGWYVEGFDRKYPEFEETSADVFVLGDARTDIFITSGYDRIYQLAAEMGGAGYVFTGENDAEILSNSLAININVLKQVKNVGCGTLFYSSSVCGYADEVEGKESDAYPANPPSNYGWEKLTSERLYLAYAKNYGLNIRIARFHNTFGPYGTWRGGREKAPAAICRKIIESSGEIEVWGDGKQLRPFIYIEDLLDGIEALMFHQYKQPVNLGPNKGITIDELIDVVTKISGKKITKKYIDGPTGGQIRNANNDLAFKELSWYPVWDLERALRDTYNWIKTQI